MTPRLVSAYLTGRYGYSIALLYIGNGSIYGIDAGDAEYTGKYERTDTGLLSVSLQMVLPKDANTISGFQPIEATPIHLDFVVPKTFLNGETVLIESMLGPINARFVEKVQIK